MSNLAAVKPQESEPSEASVEVPPKRKRGRQKGIAKPPGSGRRKAQPGLSGRAAREYLSKHSNVLEIYCRISRGQPIKLAGPTGKVVWHYPSWDDVRWVCERVDRKLIPDLTAMALTGEDGGPVQSQQHTILEASQRVLAAFPTGSSTDDTVATIGPDALEGVKALNYIQASQEAAERDQAPLRYSAPVVDVATPESSGEPEESVEEEPVLQGPPTPPDPGHVLRVLASDWYITGLGPERPGLPDNYELRCPTGLVRRGPFALCMDLLTTQMGGVIDEWRIEAPAPQPETSRPDQRAVRGWVQPQVNRRPRI